MNKVARNISVDSGTIMISDRNFYEYITEDDSLFKKFKVENGRYIVTWKISKTWNGDVLGKGFLNVESGEIIISDPCYHYEKHCDWIELLSKTDFLRNPPEGTLVLDKMGGDGTYNVYFNLEKIME